jgi:hypothetical protein
MTSISPGIWLNSNGFAGLEIRDIETTDHTVISDQWQSQAHFSSMLRSKEAFLTLRGAVHNCTHKSTVPKSGRLSMVLKHLYYIGKLERES